MTALTQEPIRGDPDGARSPATALLERRSSPPRELPAVTVLAARARRLARRVSTGVIPYLSYQVQSVGRIGVVGVALLVFSLVCFLTAISPLRQQLEGLRAQLAQSEQEQQAHHGSRADLTPAAQLRTFVSTLPARSELPAITAQVVEQATAAGLVLERGSYDFTVTRSGRIVRARLSFPVQGSYPHIRQFIDATLAAIPEAAVDGLRLERKAISAGEVSADIRFAVFLRSEQ